MRETHLRRVPFVPADEPDQSLRARARRRVAALSWSRRHSLRWLVPPLVASAVVNGVLLLSALTEPDEMAPLASTRVTSALNAASAKVGPTTSILEQGAEFAGSISSLPPSTTATTPATSELAISPPSTASPATAAPPTASPTTAAPTTAAPTTAAPAPAAPTTAVPPTAAPAPAGPTTAAPTTQARPLPVAAAPTTAPSPTTNPPAPTVAIRTPTTESNGDDDEADDRENRQDDRRDEREDRQDDREDDRSDRRDERNRRD